MRVEHDRQRRLQELLRSMRVRILAAIIGLLFASSIVSVVLSRGLLFESLDDEIRGDLVREAEEFRRLASGTDPGTGEPFGTDLRAIFDVYFDREVPDEGETLLAFVDGELYASAQAQDGAEDLGGAIDRWLALTRPQSGSYETPEGQIRYVAMPLLDGEPPGLFVVANSPAFEQAEIDDALRTQAITQLIALVLASLLGLALAGRVLRPLLSLAQTARGISDTDLTQRIPLAGRDEASQIARTFNDMLARLEQAFTTQRRFLDDAGHELRVPLTVIRGHVELLELDTDPSERRATIAIVTDEIDRMDRIVNDLLLLARAEQPDFVQPRPLDLRELTIGIHRKATALGDRDWRLAAPAATTIVADGQLLTQAVVQLASNACQHTGQGATIWIGAKVDAAAVRLWVRDDGDGVPAEQAERIFQRFTRGTARGPGSGAGLGLSIVRAIAEAHGGSARLVPHAGRGAWFELILPTRPSGNEVVARGPLAHTART
jgi:signal transduction histidine kinase